MPLKNLFKLFAFVFIFFTFSLQTFSAGTKGINLRASPTINWTITNGTATGGPGCLPDTTYTYGGDTVINQWRSAGGSASGAINLGSVTQSGTFTFTCNHYNTSGTIDSTDSTTLIVCGTGTTWDIGTNTCIAPTTYTITTTAGAGGSITPTSPINVTSGGSQVVQSWPNAGYHIASELVDGVDIGSTAQNYTFSNVIANHTFSATFAINDGCGTGSGTTPQNPKPTGTSACSGGTFNSTSPADTTTAWNWSCGAVTTCSAPKYGCTTTTDTNYNATGPNNTFGCALTCANGGTNYPTCTAPTFTCAGTAPTGLNFTQRPATTVNGTWTYATTGECTWSCNTGYIQSGNTCVLPAVDTCGIQAGTIQPSKPTGTNACSIGTLNSTTPADTTSAWNWTCGALACTAEKPGCNTTTDTNYSGTVPANTYNCANTCANGGTNYSTCTAPACANGANNPTACNACTAPLVWNTTSISCVSPLAISVSPATYSVTLPSSTVTATYSLTNGTALNTNCRLLDNVGTPLTAYASCSGSLLVTAPTTVGVYAYSIQASKVQTMEVKTSNTFNVTVNQVPVCTNGATNWSTCNQCPVGLWWDGVTSSCKPCSGTGCGGAGGTPTTPYGSLVCSNGSSNVYLCTTKPVVSILVGGGTNIFTSNYTPHTESLVWSADPSATSCVGGGDWTSTPSPFNGGSAFTSSLVNGLSTSKVFTYPYSCSNAGGTTLATANVTVCPSNLPVWNGASCQPLPTNTGFVINYLAYPLMTPANFNISCADSDSFSLYNNASFVGAYSVPQGPISATASGRYSAICKKTSADGHIFTSSPAIRDYSILPPPPIVSIKQTPATISKGTATVISWEVQYPTAQCALNAIPVCANASCTDAQLKAGLDVNTIITTQLTDTNDLGGVGRLISDAIKTIVPQALSGRQDWKAFGKKTFNLNKSMDFELNCQGTGSYGRQKVRVMVTSSNEG